MLSDLIDVVIALTTCLILVGGPPAISVLVNKKLGKGPGVVSVLLWFAAMYFGATPLYQFLLPVNCAPTDDCMAILLAPMIFGTLMMFLSIGLIGTLIAILQPVPQASQNRG